jgi:hypothetical protein
VINRREYPTPAHAGHHLTVKISRIARRLHSGLVVSIKAQAEPFQVCRTKLESLKTLTAVITETANCERIGMKIDTDISHVILPMLGVNGGTSKGV